MKSLAVIHPRDIMRMNGPWQNNTAKRGLSPQEKKEQELTLLWSQTEEPITLIWPACAPCTNLPAAACATGMQIVLGL